MQSRQHRRDENVKSPAKKKKKNTERKRGDKPIWGDRRSRDLAERVNIALIRGEDAGESLLESLNEIAAGLLSVLSVVPSSQSW